MEAKAIKDEITRECEQQNVLIDYKLDDNWESGYSSDGNNDDWVGYKSYNALVIEVGEYDRKRYKFGNIEEGDLVIVLPHNTDLPKKADSYKIKHNEIEYTSKSPLKPYNPSSTTLYYQLAGGR